MTTGIAGLILALNCVLLLVLSCIESENRSVTVPIELDHNRMLVDAQIHRSDGSWRSARLWVDSGNPDFFMTEALARDFGIDLSAAEENIVEGKLEVSPPRRVRIGRLPISLAGVKSYVVYHPPWLFSTMHADANLPSTVLKQFDVVFDYPGLRLTLAEPGRLKPSGQRVAASVHPATGIVQIDAVLEGDSLCFALDNGASYSFTSEAILARASQNHPTWPRITGAAGCANIWGWWPQEDQWVVMRLPALQWGGIELCNLGLVGLPEGFPLFRWYSQKTARPVDGLLGPNALKPFRVTIDYADSAVYFQKQGDAQSHDMDFVGITLRPLPDGSYQIIGVVARNGEPVLAGIEPGDDLLRVDGLIAKGATMGTVVDALRGRPGEKRTLELERNGARIMIEATVQRLL